MRRDVVYQYQRACTLLEMRHDIMYQYACALLEILFQIRQCQLRTIRLIVLE